MEYLDSLLVLLNEMSFYLILGCLVAGILHVAAPKSFYRKYFSKNNFSSVLYSSLFGIPLPLCSCGVIPTAVAVYKEGASKGATVSFLTSTPQTGVDSILATYGVLGLPFAIIRPIIAFVTSLISGVLVNIFAPERKESTNQHQECAIPTDTHIEKKSFWHSVVDALKYAFVDMPQSIGGNLIVGILIAGVISVAVPDSFFTFFKGNYLLEMLAVLVVAIPMYVCATGSIPIAAALMLKGISPGAALVFLMAGPATNMASLLVVGKVVGRKATIIYLSVIIVCSIAFGYLINYAMPSQWFGVSNVADCEHSAASTPVWQWISTIAFLAMLAYAMTKSKIENYRIKKRMKNQKIYKVEGMTCNHCKASVENGLKKIEGVTDVMVDLSSGYVTVLGNVTEKEISETVENLGFAYKGVK